MGSPQEDLTGKELKNRLRGIRLLALDVDGVLTDGCINIGNQNEAFKSFYAKDGLGISLAVRHDLKVVIVTGRISMIVHNRARELELTDVMDGVRDKGKALEHLAAKYKLKPEEIAFMGDDLNDLPALVKAGLAAAPADAAPEVRERCQYVAPSPGGHGAVRNLVEEIFKARGLWDKVVDEYLLAGQGDKQ